MVQILDQTVGSYGVLDAHEISDELDVKLEELTRLGYTFVDSGLDEIAIDQLRTGLAEVYTRQAEAFEHDSLERSQDADVARCLLAYDQAFFDLATNALLLGFCRRIWPSFTLLQQNGLINRPSRSHFQLKWHRDLPYQHWVASRPIAIAALFCLDEFNATTGGTYALPASHLHEGFPSESFVRRHQRVMTASPGTFIVMDAMTFHRAGKNTSAAVRRGVNHLIGLPFLGQQIDIPEMLKGSHRDDPELAGYLGYTWGPAGSVEAWRNQRLRRA